MQVKAQNDILEALKKEFAQRSVPYGNAFSASTPRRLACVFQDVPETLPEVITEKQGPRVGVDQKTVTAFLNANKVDESVLEKRLTEKGEYYFVQKITPACKTRDMLSSVIENSIKTMQWPKSMRWANGTFRWPRPLQRVVAVFNEETIPGQLDLGGGLSLPFTNKTQGHRFLSPEDFVVRNYAQYEQELYKRNVIIDRDKRKDIIVSQAAEVAKANDISLIADDGLLEEVIGLVEWPVVLKGQFNESFLNLPSEVISTSMRVNQKYFSTQTPTGFSSNFIFVSNMKTIDEGKTTIKGNQKVINARLSDAQFFWNKDIEIPLEKRVEDLKKIKFHEKLGSMYEKVSRMEKLSGTIAEKLEIGDIELVKRGAKLAKADLTTSLVFEFPELQGVIGHYCAKQDGEDSKVANAARWHYMPQGPHDACPTEGVAAIVALADKIDTLTGFFSINEVPASSKDPFALRRAAQGAVRIVLENKMDLDLFELIDQSANDYNKPYPEKINDFMYDRLRHVLAKDNHKPDVINSVLKSTTGCNPLQIANKVTTLQEFLDTEAGAETIVMTNRVGKILASSKISQQNLGSPDIDQSLFKKEEEHDLYKSLEQLRRDQKEATYVDMMENIHKVSPVLSKFFENVMVNDQNADLRNNRLKMLVNAQQAFNQIADFSCIRSEETKTTKKKLATNKLA